MRLGRSPRRRGFTYVALLAAVALAGLGLATIGPMWAEQMQRDRERDLLRAGQAYAEAIAAYYHAAPGNRKRYPPKLDDLLLDTRFVGVRRHLRRLWPDPLHPTRPWGVVRAADGGVAGVYSQDPRTPWRRVPLSTPLIELDAAQRYSDWKFVPKVRS